MRRLVIEVSDFLDCLMLVSGLINFCPDWTIWKDIASIIFIMCSFPCFYLSEYCNHYGNFSVLTP